MDQKNSYQNQKNSSFNRDLYEPDGVDANAASSSQTQSTSAIQNFLKNNFQVTTTKIPLTFIYCIVFWNFGICVALFGPTLLDLACRTSSTLSAMSALYFIQNLSSLVGCYLSGVILKNKMYVFYKQIILQTFSFNLSLSPSNSNFILFSFFKA